MEPINCVGVEKEHLPEEILVDTMVKMKERFDKAVDSNDYVAIVRISDELIKVSKTIAELRSGNVVKDVMDRLGALGGLLEK